MIDERVFYLAYSPERQGYVLPNELDEWDEIGCGTTVFALIAVHDNEHRHYPPILHIKAIYEGSEQIYNMNLVEKNIYRVSPENLGDIFFRISWKHRQRYVGKKGIYSFAILTPTDIMQLEELYLEHNFFFIGI